MTPNIQSIEERTEKFDSIKFKHFFSVKDPIKGYKDKLQTGEKYLQTTYPTKYLGYIKNSQNSTIKKEKSN